MRILIVEDEHKIATSLKKGLELEGYTVDVAFEGIEGYDMASTVSYDVIVLDRMLPEMEGSLICQKLRQENVHTPILMLTAKGELSDKVEGLDKGADDYLVKPFAFAELLARIRALTRRPKDSFTTHLSYNGLQLNPTTFEVTRDGELIKLSRREFSLLEYLLRHSGRIVTKDQIIEHVWNYDADILPNTIEVYIGYLRQKIDKKFPDKASLIHTVRGFGYKLGEK